MFFKKEELNSVSFREYLSLVTSAVKAGLIYLSKGGLGAFLKILATILIIVAVQIALSLMLMVGVFLSLILPFSDVIALLLSIVVLLIILPITSSLNSLVSWESYNLLNKNKLPSLGVLDFVKSSLSADKLKYFFLISIVYGILYGIITLVTMIFPENLLLTLLIAFLSIFAVYYPFSSLVSYWYFNDKKARSLSFNEVMNGYIENAKAFLGIGGIKLFLSEILVGAILIASLVVLAVLVMGILAIGGMLAFIILIPVLIVLGFVFTSIIYSYSFIPFFLLIERFKKA